MLKNWLAKEQAALDEWLQFERGYELLWMGDSLIHGPEKCPILRCFEGGDHADIPSLKRKVRLEIGRFPFRDHSLDCVVLSHFCEGLEGDQLSDLMKEIERVLCLDGRLIILGILPIGPLNFLQNLLRGRFRLRLEKDLQKRLWLPQKIRLHSKNALIRQAKKQGLTLKKQKTGDAFYYALMFEKRSKRLVELPVRDDYFKESAPEISLSSCRTQSTMNEKSE